MVNKIINISLFNINSLILIYYCPILYRMFNRIKNLILASIRKSLNLLKKKNDNISEIPTEIRGPHDCGLRALHTVLPEISVKKMIDGFTHCCEWWPYKGISNKEFNITLSYLKIKDRFEYTSNKVLKIGDLKDHKNDTFIVLIYGHYTVVRNGKSLEFYSKQTKIFCCWRLKK